MSALLDRLHQQAHDGLRDLEADAEREIREKFAQLGTKPAREIEVPYVDCNHIVQYTAIDALMLELLRDECVAEAELLAVLESSKCPYVAKLREKLCSKWVDHHATAISEARFV